MKKEDFKVGQTVYLLRVNNAARYIKEKENLIIEGIVKLIGKKYITVNDSKFDIESNFKQKKDSVPDYKLFLTKQDIYDTWEKENLEWWFKSSFDFLSKKDFSLGALREAKRILEESV